jgi:putative heme-binding domain-containing protein
MQTAAPGLAALFDDTASTPAARVAAGAALLAIDPARHLDHVGGMMTDGSGPSAIREGLVTALAAAGPAGQRHLARALARGSPRLRERTAFALAGTASGARILMDAAREDDVSMQLLRDPTLRERLAAGKPESIQREVADVARSNGTREAARMQQVSARAARFDARRSSAEQGARVFAANCSACHSVRGQGGQVGPQLDGVGHRSPTDLMVKVLAPNRSVAPAFRYETVIMKNGDVFTGLFRREQGVTAIFVDREAREIRVPKAQIAERRISSYTLMPNTFMESLPEADLHHLTAYLGTLR